MLSLWRLSNQLSYLYPDWPCGNKACGWADAEKGLFVTWHLETTWAVSVTWSQENWDLQIKENSRPLWTYFKYKTRDYLYGRHFCVPPTSFHRCIFRAHLSDSICQHLHLFAWGFSLAFRTCFTTHRLRGCTRKAMLPFPTEALTHWLMEVGVYIL